MPSLLILLLLTACNFKESKIVFGKAGEGAIASANKKEALSTVTIQPHIVSRISFSEQMTAIFDPGPINFGTWEMQKTAMANSVFSTSYNTKRSTGDQLGEGCDPYVIAIGGNIGEGVSMNDYFNLRTNTQIITNINYGCNFYQAGTSPQATAARMPAGKVDVTRP